MGLGSTRAACLTTAAATVELGQNNTDVAIPLLVSSKGYALMWNTAALTYVDNRFPSELVFSAIAGKSIDYYFIYGPEMDTIIHEYRSMTGHAPMLPKWAYGFFQSKDRYESLDEIHRHRAALPRGAHSAGRDGAGLVLVEDGGRSGIQQQLPRCAEGS